MLFGVAQVQSIHHHANVGGVFSRLPGVRYFDEFEGSLVHAWFELFVALPVTIGLFHDDAAFEQQFFQHQLNVELGVLGVANAKRDVFEITKQRQALVSVAFACHAAFRRNPG